LSSELHAQPNITLLLLPVESGAAAAPHISTASLAIAFQACCDILRNVGGGGGRHGDTKTKVKTSFSVYILLT